MPLQPFTRNYQDNSTDAGFQFTFNCDICNDGYKTNFIASKTYKKRGFWKGVGTGRLHWITTSWTQRRLFSFNKAQMP